MRYSVVEDKKPIQGVGLIRRVPNNSHVVQESSTALHSMVQCSALQFSAVQCDTVQYRTVPRLKLGS